MPSRKRQVLDCLTKRTLVDLSQAFGFAGRSVLTKEELAGFHLAPMNTGQSAGAGLQNPSITKLTKNLPIKTLMRAMEVIGPDDPSINEGTIEQRNG